MVVAEGKRSVLDVALLLPTLFDASQNPVPPEAVGAFCHAAASFDGHCSLEIVSEDASALALALVASLTAFWNKSIRLVRVFYETASSQLTPHSGGKQQSSGSAYQQGRGRCAYGCTVCAQGSRIGGLGCGYISLAEDPSCHAKHEARCKRSNKRTHGRKARRRAHVCRSHSHTACTAGVMCGASDGKTVPRGLDDGVRPRLWIARVTRVLRKKGSGSLATSPPTRWR